MVCPAPGPTGQCAGSSRGLGVQMGQDRTGHTPQLGSGSRVGLFAGVVASAVLASRLSHTSHTQPGQAEDFVCVCSLSLSFAHP